MSIWMLRVGHKVHLLPRNFLVVNGSHLKLAWIYFGHSSTHKRNNELISWPDLFVCEIQSKSKFSTQEMVKYPKIFARQLYSQSLKRPKSVSSVLFLEQLKLNHIKQSTINTNINVKIYQPPIIIIKFCNPLMSASLERRSLHHVWCKFIHKSRSSNSRSRWQPITTQVRATQ